MDKFVGIDIGTSGLKATLIDEEARVLDTVSFSYPLYCPADGFSEQDPQDWFEKTLDALSVFFDEHGQDIKAIALSGQMHGLVLLDKEGKVLRRAILWNDGRSQAEVEALNRDKPFLLRESSNIAFAGFTLPKLLWVKEHERDIFDRIGMILLPKDYVNYRLTGIYKTERSDVSGTLFFDLKNNRYSQALLALAGIREDQLPPVCQSQEILGFLSPEIQERLRIRHKVAVLCGMADNTAASIANGVYEEGDLSISLGTSGTILMPLESYHPNPVESIHDFAFIEDRFAFLACTLSCASANKWWMENILQSEDYQGKAKEIEGNLGKGSVFFLPYLSGERSPVNDASVRGLFYNLGISTTQRDLTQAVIEGVCYSLKDCLEAMRKTGIPLRRAVVTGGGTRISVFPRVLASMLNLPLTVLAKEGGASYGAALLALRSVGRKDIRTLTAGRKGDVILPEEELVKAYEKGFRIYKKLYPAIKDL